MLFLFNIHIAWFIVALVGALLVGLVVGFFVAQRVFKNYLKKNPPIKREQIKAMMKQMGRTPSEKQVRQVMASMNAQKTTK